MKVKDVMRKQVITIEPSSSVKDAVKKMASEKITSLIVEEKGSESVLGIITRKDVVSKVIACDLNMNSTKVSDIMSEPILSVSSDITLETVARLMAKTDIRRFPVLDGSKLVGLISNSDVMKAVSKAGKKR